MELPIIHDMQRKGRSSADPFGILPGGDPCMQDSLMCSVGHRCVLSDFSPTVGGVACKTINAATFSELRVGSCGFVLQHVAIKSVGKPGGACCQCQFLIWALELACSAS